MFFPRKRKFQCLLILLVVVSSVQCENKYSREANAARDDPDASLRDLDKPFRMSKLNLLWRKAVARLTESKLKSIFSELKIHDKEEITWKRLKSEGKDKDGLEEAKLRKRLIGIMSTYGLLEHFETIQKKEKFDQEHPAFNEAADDYINKSMFKDKKLNKLWSKAENAGFTAEELRALREEFYHHQDKIDQYYSLLDRVNNDARDDQFLNSIDENHDKFNEIETVEEETNAIPKQQPNVNVLREKHTELRDGFDRLHRLAAKGPKSKEFVEPKVQGLWKMAVNANFSNDELESLRVELKHYENRLLKLRQLQIETVLGEANVAPHGAKSKVMGKDGDQQAAEDRIKKQSHKIQILHELLEEKIIAKHIEL